MCRAGEIGHASTEKGHDLHFNALIHLDPLLDAARILGMLRKRVLYE